MGIPRGPFFGKRRDVSALAQSVVGCLVCEGLLAPGKNQAGAAS